jgi:hypothetical protein
MPGRAFKLAIYEQGEKTSWGNFPSKIKAKTDRKIPFYLPRTWKYPK